MTRTSAIAMAAASMLVVPLSASAAERTLDLAGFSRLDVATGIHAEITEADSYSVRVEAADEAILDDLKIVIEDDTLHAGFDQSLLDFIFDGGLLGAVMRSDRNVTIYISAPPLAGVDASSGARVHFTSATASLLEADASSGASIEIDALDVGALELDASSGARITLSGTCGTASLDFSSGSSIRAQGVACSDVSVDGSSGASAEIETSGGVTGSLSSGARLLVSGNPQAISVTSSSGGNLQLN